MSLEWSLYVLGMVGWLTICSVTLLINLEEAGCNWGDGARRTVKWAARAIFVSPVWPLALSVVLILGGWRAIRVLIRLARTGQ